MRDISRKSSLWYRIDLADLSFKLTDVNEPWTLSVGAPLGAVAIYRNNQLLAEVGRRRESPSVIRAPVSLDVSYSLLEPNDVLYVQFVRANSQGYVFANYLAPRSALQPYLKLQKFLRVTLLQWIQVLMCAVGVLMLTLFWLRPSDHVYKWWGLMLFAWAIREGTDLSIDPWVSSDSLWAAIRGVSLGAFAVFGYLFIKSFLGVKRSLCMANW